MKKIVTLGEIMLRLSPPGYERFLQANSFDINYGGAEANVALALSNLGYETQFVTKVPDNAIGHAAINSLRKYGVHTENVIFGGNRLGLYYLEKGYSVRASNVIYDRAGSAFANVKSDDFNFDKIFDKADLFLVTGISPAVSPNACKLTKKALEFAKEKGLTIVIDVNYRAKMWSLEDANETMKDLLKYADIIIGFSPDILLEIKEDLSDNKHEKLLKRMVETYGVKNAVSTFRKSHSANRNSLYARLYDGKKLYTSKEYSFDMVDRVGGGDSFTSGLISGLLDGKDTQETLEFATATSVWKHTILGDANVLSKEEIEKLSNGGSTLVQR